MSPGRLFAITLKEVRQIRRDRLTLAMIVGVPILQLVLFGYAINTEVRHLPAAIVDQADTHGSRVLVQDLIATGVVREHSRVPEPAAAMHLIEQGQVSVAILVPADFERRRATGDELAQVVVDGSDTVIANAARLLSQQPVDDLPPARISVLGLYNPERRAPINIVPGLVGVILTMTMVLFTAVSIVRESERGNLELLITTPVTRAELMIGKIIPYAIAGLAQTSVVLALGYWLFRVPVRGSLLDVFVAAAALILANLALGLVLSTRARSQFQAMQLAFFVFLPSILLSGFMFPFAGMPPLAQWIAEALPLTHFMRLIRGLMLRGAPLADLWVEFVALLGFAALMLTIATLSFRKRLE